MNEDPLLTATAAARRGCSLDGTTLRASDLDGFLLSALGGHLELNLLTLHQGSEAIGQDLRLVHKEVFTAAGRRDEAKPFV
jgi:hypothetical protein